MDRISRVLLVCGAPDPPDPAAPHNPGETGVGPVTVYVELPDGWHTMAFEHDTISITAQVLGSFNDANPHDIFNPRTWPVRPAPVV